MTTNDLIYQGDIAGAAEVLRQQNLEIVPGSGRWEVDPKTGRERYIVIAQPNPNKPYPEAVEDQDLLLWQLNRTGNGDHQWT